MPVFIAIWSMAPVSEIEEAPKYGVSDSGEGDAEEQSSRQPPKRYP